MSSADVQNVKSIVLIIVVIVSIFILYRWIKHNLKHKDEVITAFTGGLGSSKTLQSVELVNSLCRKARRQFKWRSRWVKIKNAFHVGKYVDLDALEYPVIFSNIPIVVKRASRLKNLIRKIFKMSPIDDEYCLQLTKEHLLLQERLPKGCIILIDEIGAFANQFDYNQNNVIRVFDEFVRFYRHYLTIEELNIEPHMVVNDQCSENINLVIRRRLCVIHNLSNFFKLWKFGFFFERMITVSEEIKTIDYKTGTGVGSDTQDNSNFRWKFFRSFGCYDSHCYSDRYNTVPSGVTYSFTRRKLNELLTCPTDKQKRYYPKTDNKENSKERR